MNLIAEAPRPDADLGDEPALPPQRNELPGHGSREME